MDPLDFKPLGKEARDEILEYIRSRIDEADPERLRQAVQSLGWIESASELAGPLLLLVREGRPAVALAALEGLAQIGARESEKPLARFILDLFKRNAAGYEEVRAEGIRTLGKIGTRRCMGFLAEIIRVPAPATDLDREAAVEALVSLAERRVRGIAELLEDLRRTAKGVVEQALTCALKELNVQQWEKQGFLTIEADFDPSGDSLFD
ncbi:MAG: HEAT repeat domain-containing protein [Candidatus Glassbacteria bacterium]